MKAYCMPAIVFLLISCGPPRNQGPICCSHEPNPPGRTNLLPPKTLLADSVKPDVADLRIDTAYVLLEGDSIYTLRALIRNGGNNCADPDQTYAVITLPQQTKVQRIWAINLNQPPRFLTHKQCQAQITVRLDSLCPGYKGNYIAVRVRRSPYRHPECQPSFSVHVYSTKPDPDPRNNYWWWRRQCLGGREDLIPDAPTRGPDEQPQPSKGGL